MKVDFATWLNGWVELNRGGMPDAAQWETIKDHLKLHFTKVTPPIGSGGNGDSGLGRRHFNLGDHHPHYQPITVNDPSVVPAVLPMFPGVWPNQFPSNNTIIC